MTKIIENFKEINDVKKMSLTELAVFSQEIRDFLIEKVSKTGGHLASNLGVGRVNIELI